MAILNTAHAVLKNVETRKQVHIIQQELAKLALDFSRFETRMGNLARHIKQASVDVDEVHVSTQKITKRFGQIHRVELDAVAANPLLSETPASLNDDADIPEDDA
jgi:DNA recombination protein RmuC